MRSSEWILGHTEYHKWRSGPEHTDAKAMFFCIKGHPGSGKSTLIQHALERHKAQRGDHYVVSFFFNAYGPYSQRNVSYMYQSLLVQVLENMPRIPSEAVSTENLSLNAVWETYALRELLEYIIPLLDKPLFCFIDASGCQPMDLPDIIHLFDRIAKTCEHKTSLRVCFTYPHDKDIPEVVTQMATISLETQEGHRRDILRFMGQHLESSHHNSFEQLDQLAQKAEANFLWGKLAIGLLQKDFSQAGNFQMGRAAVVERMQDLPRGLPQLFNYILNEADRQQDDQFLLLLKSVNQSPKPPKAEEMYKLTRSTAEVFRRQTKDGAVHSILDLSRGLLEITGKKGSHVRFVHSCIPQLLESLEIVGGARERSLATSPGVAHDRIKNDCIELLRRLNDDMIDLETATYAVENVIPNADEAQRLGVSQADFVTSFPVTEWIQLTNIISGHENFAANTSLIYVLADMNMPHLILAHPASLQSYLLPNSGMLGTPLFVALAKMNKETLFAFLNLERGRTKPMHPYSNSWAPPDEHAKLCAQYFGILQEAHQTGTMKHILSPESSKLSDMTAVIAFMKRPGNEILHLFLMLAGRVDMDSQAFETTKAVAQVKRPLLLEYPGLPKTSQITSRGMADGSMSQSASQVLPRGAAQEYYESFETHPDGYNSHQTDAHVEPGEITSKALGALEMDRFRLTAGKSAERSVEHPLKKGDAVLDSKKAKSKSEKHRKASTIRKRRTDKKRSAAVYDSSDEEISKKVLSSKSKKHHVKPHTKSDGQRGHTNATHKNKQRNVKAQDAHGPNLGAPTKAGRHELSKPNKDHSDKRHIDKRYSDKSHSNTRTLFVTETTEIQTSNSKSTEHQKLHDLRVCGAHAPPKGPPINDINATNQHTGDSASEDCGSDEVSSSDSSSSSDTSSDSTSSEDSQSIDEDDLLISTPHPQIVVNSQSPSPFQDHEKPVWPPLDDLHADGQSVRGDMQAPNTPMGDAAINQHDHHSIRNHHDTSFWPAFTPESHEEIGTRHMNHHHQPEGAFSPISPVSVYPSITSTRGSQANSPSSHGSTSSSSSSSSGDESSDEDRDFSYTQYAGIDMTSAGKGSDSETDEIYSPDYGHGQQYESSDSSNDDDDGGHGKTDEIEDGEDSHSDVGKDDVSDNGSEGDHDGQYESSDSATGSYDDQLGGERYDSDSD
ncbi:uncharacterized protein N0V89_007159 [Didymosphaeria variabile]|uniref:Nephrocystin 3-like N-terminal domain-containing protein n=1 Tax=Didymosphaeria variabile TaxID=1932322 RepID=A0A9W8XKY2_9PLEO|nr:uncharacterized protein N0V89_007159 [Didymosphaeria variabile]KAJ4351815.1 hypothetical protein N0V89_007159 [Didymosphaeria variabile]